MILSNSKIKDLTGPKNITFNYGSGRLTLDSNGGYIAGIEIHFEGKIDIVFMVDVSKNAICEKGNDKIIILNLTDHILQGEILHYKGYFKIKNIIVSNSQGKQVGAALRFNKIKNKAENLDMYPEEMDMDPAKMKKGFFYGKYRTKNKAKILKKQGKTKRGGASKATTKQGSSTSGPGDY